jgi:hypothetical protein
MSKQPNYVFDDELYHHGIQGQRWGFRRFQNEDGSWTPEGRERYGKGENPYKKEVKKYFVQKFKADIKSQKSKDKNTRLAREERHKLREWGKTQRLAKKEQAKIDGSKNPAIQDTRNMSDDDLQKAINRLKLQSEYNKQYTLATNPNGALAKADRFFEGPTGQVVKAVAVATLPKVAETATSKILESNLKYANSLDREKAKAEIEKTKAEAKNPSQQGSGQNSNQSKGGGQNSNQSNSGQNTSGSGQNSNQSKGGVQNTNPSVAKQNSNSSVAKQNTNNINININKEMSTPVTKISGQLPAKISTTMQLLIKHW